MTTRTTPIILWTRPDNTVVVTELLDPNADIEAEVAKIKAERPELTYRKTTDFDETPVSINPFYPALVMDENGELAYDMVKARELYREGVRQLRQPALAALDVEFQRAFETGDTVKQAEIVAKKNELRDAPNNPEIDTAQDLNDLQRLVPEILAN